MRHRYEVVVIGAGMVGMLTALALAERDIGVLLVESSRPGGGQSGRSHGYLHQGYAYGTAEPLLPSLFTRARSRWDRLATHLTPVTERSTVAFADEAAARGTAAHWASAGLPVERVDPPAWLAPRITSCFRSSESTLYLGHLLHALGERLEKAGVHIARGEVVRTGRDGNGVTTEYTGPDGSTVSVAARVAVVAAGAGAAGVLERSGLPRVVQCRKSHMLVLRGDLPAVSAIFPEREHHGLFLASRIGPDRRTTWLISDFQSFDGTDPDSGELAGWWARRILTTLRSLVGSRTLEGVDLVSGYAATKSGLLPQSGTVAHEFGREFLDGRVVVTSPSKLTLAPLAAEDAVRSVCAVLGLPRAEVDWPRLDAPPGDIPAHGQTPHELWETELAAVKSPDLVRDLPPIRVLNSLFAH
ncbi:NAD(P)/FAD-dependent oxidoreductase [Streptomyces sp. NPDC091040]|uniref:NAD(P)/FAD-dependent oxidoreductase n=1 Tax=Streptomyces sp. NPDC091040 TaxID=3365972 RepID=UPI0038220E12